MTREHIIPLALNGDWVIQKASCAKCADFTRKIEQVCCRTMLGAFRVKHKFRTRHPKQRPNLLPLHLLDDAGGEPIRVMHVTPDQHPAGMLLLRYDPARILQGLPKIPANQKYPYRAKLWTYPPTDQQKKLGLQHGTPGFRASSFAEVAFPRLLAKIAHSFAWAYPHIRGTFNPILYDVIFGKTLPFDAMGSDPVIYPATPHLHEIGTEVVAINGINYLVVLIRLFAYLGTPNYHVVVGEVV